MREWGSGGERKREVFPHVRFSHGVRYRRGKNGEEKSQQDKYFLKEESGFLTFGVNAFYVYLKEK